MSGNAAFMIVGAHGDAVIVAARTRADDFTSSSIRVAQDEEPLDPIAAQDARLREEAWAEQKIIFALVAGIALLGLIYWRLSRPPPVAVAPTTRRAPGGGTMAAGTMAKGDSGSKGGTSLSGDAMAVSLKRVGRPPVEEGGISLPTVDPQRPGSFAATPSAVIVEAHTTGTCFLSLFMVDSEGSVRPLGRGRDVEVARYEGSRAVKGTVVFSTVGQVAHCYAVASALPFDFHADVRPAVERAVLRAGPDVRELPLPLPPDRFGQAHLRVVAE